jgi:hypothetical protein
MSLTNLHGYEPFAPPRPIDFDSWSQREARSYFEWFVDQIPERIDQLRKLVEKTDGACRLDGTPESLFCLGELLFAQVAIRSSTREEIAEDMNELPSHLRPFVQVEDWQLDDLTISLCVDVGIYLAEVLVREHPHLEWALWSRKTVGHNRPVVRGFEGDVPLDPIRVVINLALGKVRKADKPTRLREVYEVWARKVIV